MDDHGFEGIEEVRIETLGELLDRVTPDQRDPVSGRLRDTAVYRGSDAAYPLLTSLDRLGGVSPPHGKAHLEEHILRNFIRYSRPFLQHAPANEWELLVTAQHHGLPTRLLDWSYSPLIAAHFATTAGGEREGDRVVWRLDWARVHQHFGLPPVAFLVQDLHQMLADRGIRDLAQLLSGDVPRGARLACMLDPPALDARIIAQAATFTFSTDKSCSFDRLLCEEGLVDALTRFVIPAERVGVIRDQLDLCAIDERKLFPDLDGVAAQMRRYYSASPDEEGGEAC